MSINVNVNLSGSKNILNRINDLKSDKLLEAGLKRGALYLKTQTRYVYTPPSALPHPNPQPGWQFRYIATSVLNEAADNNVS